MRFSFRRLCASLAAVCVAGSLGWLGTAGTAKADPNAVVDPDASVAYQHDPAHDGNSFDPHSSPRSPGHLLNVSPPVVTGSESARDSTPNLSLSRPWYVASVPVVLGGGLPISLQHATWCF